MLEAARDAYVQGGAVAPFLLGSLLVLWYALGWRWAAVRGALPEVRRLRAAGQDLGPIRERLGGYAVLIRTVVACAPLAGLLGTVIGMIETFRGLGEMALFAKGGGIAGGIGEALVSTQMGLMVAVPGLILGRLLDAAQRRREAELDELEAAFT